MLNSPGEILPINYSKEQQPASPKYNDLKDKKASCHKSPNKTAIPMLNYQSEIGETKMFFILISYLYLLHQLPDSKILISNPELCHKHKFLPCLICSQIL